MTVRISATEASRSFSTVLNRVCHGGEDFLVERGGRPVCAIVPAPPRDVTLADLVAVLRALPLPDPGFASDVRHVARRQRRTPRSPWGR